MTRTPYCDCGNQMDVRLVGDEAVYACDLCQKADFEPKMWEEEPEPQVQCVKCGTSLHPAEAKWQEDNPWCEDCFSIPANI